MRRALFLLLLLLLLPGALFLEAAGSARQPGPGRLHRQSARGLSAKVPRDAPPQLLPGAGEAAGAYLNQLSLEPAGNRKCGVASVAMLQALSGRVTRDQDAMAQRANTLWEAYEQPTRVGSIERMLDDQGLDAQVACLGPDEAWTRLTRQIDAGYPSLMLTTQLTESGSGHYVVLLGYREQAGRRQVLVYDSYGRWAGPERGYERNGSTAGSRLGEGVYYDFYEAWGYYSENCPAGYLFTVGGGQP